MKGRSVQGPTEHREPSGGTGVARRTPTGTEAPDTGASRGHASATVAPAAETPGTVAPDVEAADAEVPIRSDIPLIDSRNRSKEPQLTRVLSLLERESLGLIVPSEVFIHFYPAGPEQVVNGLRAAGFASIYFETLGDELVAFEYLRIWRENEAKRTWIRSTSPLVVDYCRDRHPELVPLLAPIVTPAQALARYLKYHQPDLTLVYSGLDSPGVNGEDLYEAHLSFSELQDLLEKRGVELGQQPQLMGWFPPERRRYISTAGGLPLPMLDQERASSRTFRKLRGLHTLAGLSRLVQENGEYLGFVDILPFDGALDHPALGPSDELYWRRELLELAEPPRADEPVIVKPPDLDLAIGYEARRDASSEEVDEVRRVLEDLGTEANGQFWKRDPRGFATYLAMAESLMRGQPEVAIGLFRMTKQYSKAIRDATHDALTDLYTYRALMERLDQEMARANRSGSTLGLLFVDLDVFKEINDRYGHPVGNEILRRVASVLSNTIRATDIAARYGGDEFVVLLVNSDPHGAVRVAEQIRQRVEEIEVPVSDGTVGTSTSIGMAFHSGSERSLLTSEDLLAEADASLYIAKAHGGNRVHPMVREAGSL